jgi:hypothetical protein
MKEITLPSGAILKITLAPFSDAKALYQAFLEEMKTIEVSSTHDFTNLFKNLVCIGFSSKKIESCLEVCLKRCTYNYGKGDLKIDKDSFEPAENRGDYMSVCTEVAKENILPFMKSLYVQYQQLLAILPDAQA